MKAWVPHQQLGRVSSIELRKKKTFKGFGLFTRKVKPDLTSLPELQNSVESTTNSSLNQLCKLLYAELPLTANQE